MELTKREEWLYEIVDMKAQLIFHIIDLITDPIAKQQFIDRQANLNRHLFDSRNGDASLKIENIIIEDELKSFKDDLIIKLRESASP